MGQKIYDWVSLEVEYRIGDIEGLTEFFKIKGIPQATWQKMTKGWIDKRRDHLIKLGELTARKALTRRSTQMAEMIEDAELGRQVALQYLKDKPKLDSARDAMSIVKMAQDIKLEALNLEDPISRAEGLLGASIEVTQGKGANEVKTEIKLIARNISRSRIRRVDGGQPVLGPGEYPDGEQQAL